MKISDLIFNTISSKSKWNSKFISECIKLCHTQTKSIELMPKSNVYKRSILFYKILNQRKLNEKQNGTRSFRFVALMMIQFLSIKLWHAWLMLVHTLVLVNFSITVKYTTLIHFRTEMNRWKWKRFYVLVFCLTNRIFKQHKYFLFQFKQNYSVDWYRWCTS